MPCTKKRWPVRCARCSAPPRERGDLEVLVSGAAVVIEIAPADAGSIYAPLLLGACSEGIQSPGGCALADAESRPPSAIAVVSWDGQGHHVVHVEVGVRRGARSEWL